MLFFERLKARDTKKMREENAGSGIKCEHKAWWVSGALSVEIFEIHELHLESFWAAVLAMKLHKNMISAS